MTDNDESSLDHVPPIIPARDEVVHRQQTNKKGAPRGKQTPHSGGAGMVARLFIVIALIVAAVATAWAWQQQQQLDAAAALMVRYEARISDLEDRLSDTDEGMNQSAASLGVRIKELTSEVDKLWASAWRKNKAKIAALETSSSAHGSQLATLANTDTKYSAQLKSLATDVGQLRSVAGGLERLVSTGKANQVLLERLGDDVSRASLDVAKLQKKVQSLQEGQAAVDGFRRQTNQSLLQLRESLAQLQNPAPVQAGQPGVEPRL